ncbi:nitrous oxide reductase family maturation protein NosD [Phenylobacterium sp.]|uniref:right-handed parallel beta-helix repeat-containing protein n=1 Tax=Phenylobacterium sp. TaxID=1871053 RepID=UPI00121409DB|nr:right-handed parallel beta-helix repeat-containing protein [Phenylobacterium sp.]THD65100.1 MAG: hypothetical protein E8A49_00030 [Phenylobacterium sp.]
MADIEVRSDAEIQPALAKAKPGDTVSFAAGTYGQLAVNRQWADPGVTIRPAPGAKVSFTNVTVANAAGVTVREFTVLSDAIGFMAINSERIVASKLDIHGALDGELTAKAGTGVIVRNIKASEVSDCDVHHTGCGIGHQGCDGLIIRGNTIHNFRFDGVRGGSSNLTVEGNEIRDMYPAPADHPDGIQFWTTLLSAPVENVTIRRNRVLRNKGLPFQGIFVADEANVGIHGLDIEENLVVSDHFHGISVYHGTSPKIIGNYVNGHEGAGVRPWIKVEGCTDPVIKDNVCPGNFVTTGSSRLPASTNVQKNGNKEVGLLPRGDDTLAEAWWAKLTGEPQKHLSQAAPPAGLGLATGVLATAIVLKTPGTRRTTLGQLAAAVLRVFSGGAA